MPFTFSHPAIVLPLNYLPKRWVSMTGLVIGSMVPDFEYFLRMRVKSTYSHTLPGLFWFDLPLGLLLVYVYERLIKDKLIQNMPTALNQRFLRFRGLDNSGSLSQYLFAVAISVLIGAISHILWDGFTHATGYFVMLVPALSKTVQLGQHQVLIYKAIQHCSTIIGAIVIILTVYALPLASRKKNHPVVGFWLQIILVLTVTLGIRLLTGLSYRQYGDLIVTIIAGGLLGLITASVTTKLNPLK